MKLSEIDVKEDTNHYESEKINGAFNDIYIEYKIKVDENNQLNIS